MTNPAGLPELGVWRNHGYRCTNAKCPDANNGYPPENPEVTHLHPNALHTRITTCNPPNVTFDVLWREQFPNTTPQGLGLQSEVFSRSFTVQVKDPSNIEPRIATCATKAVNQWSYNQTKAALYPNDSPQKTQTGAYLEEDY